LRVKEIQALASVGETVLGQIPDPEGAISDDQNQLGLAQATGQGFAIKLRAQGFEAQASGGVTALGNHRALSGSLAAVIQTEDGGHINPVPAIKFFARLPQFFSLSPVVALADIPGVDLDDQSEGLCGWALGRGIGHLLNLLPGVELGDELGAALWRDLRMAFEGRTYMMASDLSEQFLRS